MGKGFGSFVAVGTGMSVTHEDLVVSSEVLVVLLARGVCGWYCVVPVDSQGV